MRYSLDVGRGGASARRDALAIVSAPSDALGTDIPGIAHITGVRVDSREGGRHVCLSFDSSAEDRGHRLEARLGACLLAAPDGSLWIDTRPQGGELAELDRALLRPKAHACHQARDLPCWVERYCNALLLYAPGLQTDLPVPRIDVAREPGRTTVSLDGEVTFTLFSPGPDLVVVETRPHESLEGGRVSVLVDAGGRVCDTCPRVVDCPHLRAYLVATPAPAARSFDAYCVASVRERGSFRYDHVPDRRTFIGRRKIGLTSLAPLIPGVSAAVHADRSQDFFLYQPGREWFTLFGSPTLSGLRLRTPGLYRELFRSGRNRR